MSVYDIGEYRIQQLNNGWKVSWQDEYTVNRYSMMVDLPLIIKLHIDRQIFELERVLYLFDKGPDKLLDYDVGYKVIRALPESNTIPGEDVPAHKIREWHHKQLVLAYNRAFGTELTYDMVRDRV